MEYYAGNDPWLVAAVYKLRYDVFVLEQGVSPTDEFDEDPRKKVCYLLLMAGTTPIATIRYQTLDDLTINPDRFCVAQAFRRQGHGTRLLKCYEEKAKKEGYRRSVLSAEIEAQAFYEKNGYAVISDSFYEDGILCVKMAKIFGDSADASSLS